jgi:hypothetical protein
MMEIEPSQRPALEALAREAARLFAAPARPAAAPAGVAA